MAPASKATESARPDSESSVDNIAQSRLDALLAAFEASDKPAHDDAAAPSTEKPKKQDGTAHNAQPSENGSFVSNESAKKS
ncbi:hypothetical protein CTA1_7095 [Colletotrichum tanaceti]|uniref:Uncharacterized protein n=1 Tax=Colletotrichum tanaceti TaxID=1306861 RepID=A0A4U6XTU7_9PEZI|nr:hypothetical protein CTA1_7095 [Colletotrichum tanaceti]